MIDDISMTSYNIEHRVNCLQQITGAYDHMFGGLFVILCGDFKEFLPVNATPVYNVPKSSSQGMILWHQLDYFPLQQVMWQPQFSSILTKVGNKERR